MLSRLAAMLVVLGLVQRYLPSRGVGFENMTPMSGVRLVPGDTPLPSGCGLLMTAAQCPTGPCAALPQLLTLFAELPNAPIAIEFNGRFYDRTPPPPEPPPPQA